LLERVSTGHTSSGPCSVIVTGLPLSKSSMMSAHFWNAAKQRGPTTAATNASSGFVSR
jgi:hypothetical protein